MLILSLLGPFTASLGGASLARFRSNKTQALLIYLSVEAALDSGSGAGRRHRRDQLMALLWPRLPPASAQVNLRQTVYQLRQLVPHVDGTSGQRVPFLVADRHSVAIHAEAVIALDVAEFRRYLDRAPDLDAVAAAVELYRGDFLTDFYLPDSATFENWASSRRAEFRLMVLDALDRLAAHRLLQSRFVEAERYARRQLEIDNLRESAFRQLMVALDGLGRRAEALQQVALCEQLLGDELGVDLARETQQLAEAIRRGEPDALDVVPALREASCVHNVPVPVTPLIGRTEEVKAIEGFLLDPDVHLVTITGEGGIGKTRLAMAIAHRLAARSPCPFPDGIYFIALAHLSDAAHIASTLAEALLLPVRRKDTRSPRGQLLARLQEKRILIVLDNFDHLLGEATLVAEMLQAAPQLKVLVTSRERLRLHAEQIIPLQGLQYEAGDVAQPAAALFLSAARRVRPNFLLGQNDTVHLHRLCQLVEGMPLALELAATWVDILPLEEIAAQVAAGLGLLQAPLRDFPRRHRSIRAVFDASWEQLKPHEQKVLAELSVFRGGFPRAAAEAVASASPHSVSRLVDRSLLHFDQQHDRYFTHELLRQYAWEKLASLPGASVAARDHHLRYFLSLAEEIEPQLVTAAQPVWLSRLEADHENLRVALDWARRQGDAEALARLSGALGVFWGVRGYLDEGAQWLALALAQRDQLSAPAVASVLFASGWLAFERGDYVAAKARYQESHVLMAQSGKTGRVAELLTSLSHVAQQQGEFAQATKLCEESLALYREMNDLAGVASCLFRLGRMAELQGDHERAEQLITESLTLRQTIGDERGIASSLNSLAELARYHGDFDRAKLLYERSLAICTRLADKRCIAGVNHNLGHVALVHRDYARALSRFREGLLLYHELDHAEGIGLCLVGFAGGFQGEGHLTRAVLLLSAATRLLRLHNVVMTAADQATYQRTIDELTAQADAETFTRYWTAGQAIVLDEAIAQALAGVA